MNKILETIGNNILTIVVIILLILLFAGTRSLQEKNVRNDLREIRKDSESKALEKEKAEFMEGCTEELKKYECILMWNQK
jgi:hypothetical protein